MPGMEGAPQMDPADRPPKPYKERSRAEQDQIDDLNRMFNAAPPAGGDVEAPGGGGGTAGASGEINGDGGTGTSGTALDVIDRPPTLPERPNLVPGNAPPEGDVPVPESGTGTEPMRIVMASLDKNVDPFAREAAHEKLSQQNKGPFWKRVAKSMWQNISREYQTVKGTIQAREEILENKNLLHHKGLSDEKWREATIDRYGSEMAEHLMSEGETLHKLSSPEAAKDKNAQRINADVQEFMRKSARGEFTDQESADMYAENMQQKWHEEGISQDYIGEGQFMATNLGAKGREFAAMIASAEGLSEIEREALIEEHVSKIEIVAGEARVGSRTEIDSTMSERIAGKFEKVKWLKEGRLAKVAAAVTSVLGNELAVSAALSATVLLAKRGAGMAGQILAPGAGAAVVAMIREHRALLKERDLMARRLDSGEEIDEDSKRQVELGRTMYETKSVEESIGQIGEFYTETGELKIADRDDLEAALKLQADLKARIEISDTTGKRLLSFEGIKTEDMESKNFDFRVALAKLETDLKKAMADPTLQSTANLSPEETYEELSAEQKSIAIGKIERDVKRKHILLAKVVATQSLKQAGKAFLMGATGAYAMHMASEAGQAAAKYTARAVGAVKNYLFSIKTPARPFSFKDFKLASADTSTGAPDHLGANGPDHLGADGTPDNLGGNSPDHLGGETSADHLGGDAPDHLGGADGAADHLGSTTPDHLGAGPEGVDMGSPTEISDTSKVTLPEGFKAEVHGDTVTVTTPEGKAIDGITLDKDGTLSKESQELLRNNGYQVIDHKEIVDGKPELVKQTSSTSEFVRAHAHEMKTIHIQEHLNNDSSEFDLNELGLQNHMDSQGNIIITISGMTSGGSFHDGHSVNWHEFTKGGHMKVYMSANEGSQAKAFEVTFNSDGKAVVAHDSSARALFSANGRFSGGFQQASLNNGQDAAGRENISVLATVVGRDPSHITETVQKPTFHTAHHYTIFQTPQPASANTPLTPGDTNVYPFVTAPPRERIGKGKPASTPTPTLTTPTAPPSTLALPAAPAAEALTSGPAAEPEAALPAAPETVKADTADTNNDSDVDVDASSTPDPGEVRDNNAEFDLQEMSLVAGIDAETRAFPLMVEGVNMATLSPRERKFMTLLAYEAMARITPKGSGEDDYAYDERVKKAMESVVDRGLITARTAQMSGSMRSLMNRTFSSLGNLKTPRRPTA